MTDGNGASVRSMAGGAVLLVVAIALGWVVVAFGQAKAGDWVLAVLGQERGANSPALFQTVATMIVYTPLLLIGVVGAVLEKRNAFASGARPMSMLGVGVLVGVAGLTCSALYARLAGGIVTNPAPPLAVPVLALGWGVVAFQVIAEEVFFRGWLQPALVRRWGVAAGVLAGAVAFSALHIAGGARAPLSLLNLLLGGVMFGLFAARSGGIAAAVGVHLAWNGAEQMVFGLDPNGADDLWIESFGSVLDWDARGSAIWGGSPDGLNGSIGMAVALLAILVPLAVLTWRRPGSTGAAAGATPAVTAA